MRIAAVITTKNRPELLKNAVNAVVNQTRKPDYFLVISDSTPENIVLEKNILKNVPVNFIMDKYTHNYAGSLNTAIHYLVEENLDCLNIDDLYVATLDDDDTWHEDYLEKVEKNISGEDFAVTGLIYKNENGERKLSIPDNLTISDFLRKNPHIQGSNTFIRVIALLEAGLFDENMSSTTDRDIFTRVMMLNPSYKVIPEYLVDIDAFDNRARITNGSSKKKEGLHKFYSKYHGWMSDEDKKAFFDRSEQLFGISKKEIDYINPSFPDSPAPEFKKTLKDYHLVIGFIATEFELGLRLLSEIRSVCPKETDVIVIENSKKDYAIYSETAEKLGVSLKLYSSEQISLDIQKNVINVVDANKITAPVITDIALARSVLQEYLYRDTKDGDVIWVLDEDMELKELVSESGELKTKPIDISRIISEYQNDYDAVVGNYSLDAPLPTLSTLRTSLLDFSYTKLGKINGNPDLINFTDYYYDFSDRNTAVLETPFVSDASCLDDVFSGKACSRPLFVTERQVNPVYNRGGNTLIFNRELLKIPNCSIMVRGTIGRRSDYFWVLQAKKKGYRIANVPFATLHNKNASEFNYSKEERKLLKDLIGSSFTKTVERFGLDLGAEDFFKEYHSFFTERLVKYIASYYRIIGLLKALGDEKYSFCFTQDNLKYFVRNAMEYNTYSAVSVAFIEVKDNLLKIENKENMECYYSLIEPIKKGNLCFLGVGTEGLVLHDDVYVYKCFYQQIKNKDILLKLARQKITSIPEFEILNIMGTDVVRYDWAEFEEYNKGFASELAELIYQLKQCGLVFTNFKKENFILVGGHIRLIDIGQGFKEYTEESYLRNVIRCYEMVRYSFLSVKDFKEIIRLSYQGKTKEIDSGYEGFLAMCQKRYKEELHDGEIVKLIRKYKPASVLDYGAGKCKIANSLSSEYKFSVYDIDQKTINKRANDKVSVITDIHSIKAKFDLVLCNLVLCCIPDDVTESVISDIVSLMSKGGHAIFSICNPFYNSVSHTELRDTGLKGVYDKAELFEKKTRVGTPVRKEYHRPFESYVHLFQKYGFSIQSISEGGGVDTKTMLPIGEHLVFDCVLKNDCHLLNDCTLLIKTNPMEHDYIYESIRHIVSSLEKGVIFNKRIVTVDGVERKTRARKYSEDDMCKLIEELERAKANGFIDSYLMFNDASKSCVLNKKYFGIEEEATHSVNGQGTYATLGAFAAIDTNLVFQTDSDMLYHNASPSDFMEAYRLAHEHVFVTLSIAHSDGNPLGSERIEVRSSFVDLRKIKEKMPFSNMKIIEGEYSFPWHRLLDKCYSKEDKIRMCSSKLYYIHPENILKSPDDMELYRNSVENGLVPSLQQENVNLVGPKDAWLKKANEKVVIYIRGRNTTCEKLRRMFESVKMQDYTNYQVVYVDDASDSESSSYAKAYLTYDEIFKDKSVGIFRKERHGELANLLFVMKNIITNPDTVVINLDNDDYFLKKSALSLIMLHFENGADLTVGGCLRYDKPLKRYTVSSFQNIWERNGDNVWLHPKCFKRRLFDFVSEGDLMEDGKYYEVNTDFAFMSPMVLNASNPECIDELLYYFEPSFDNQNKSGKYNEQYKKEIKTLILERMRDKYEKNNSNNR